ncbi:S9 family peptidase [Congregibacter litoralis]|uniref:S9 family peptidase n=1 Tax=Congregibacter litoralis TaxID=393662 RepID=UPI000322F1A5|nr:S9 family peptidase [Congregibacter litoralis]
MACTNIDSPAQARESSPAAQESALTLEAIYKEDAYKSEAPGRLQWLSDKSGYTMLETPADSEQNDLMNGDKGTDGANAEGGEEAPDAKEIVFYDPRSDERRVLVDVAMLTPDGAEAPLVIDDYHWSKDQSKLLVYTNSKKVWRVKSRGDYWVLDLESGELRQLGGDAKASTLQFAKFSPDADKVAYVKEADVFVEDLASGAITQLSERAGNHIINGIMSWAYEEEFSIRDGFRWSPDGQRIAYWQFDTSGVRNFTLINNTDALYPEVVELPYPKVGETISAARVGTVDVSGGATVWADLPGDPRQMYVPRMDWAPSSDKIIVQHLNRRQDTNTVFYADAGSGEATEIFVEQAPKYLFDVEDVHWLEDSGDFLWLSERDGWWHIYRATADGKTFRDLTPGDFDITEVAHVDETSGWVYFMASPEAMESRFLFRSRLDGSGDMEKITPEDFPGTNSYHVSEGGQWAVHTHQSFMQPPQYRLISLPEHEEIAMLEDNAALLEKLAKLDLGEHEFFRVEARDGLPLDGYLMRPPQFDADKKYPIVFYVYSEVAGQTVRDAWGGKRHLWHLYMAQQGYLIASVDSRGARAPRGRDWRQSVYGGIGILASRDQSDALTAMARRWSYIDEENVGIWGHSGGGSMTLNMLFRYPGQYKAGVSQAPVTDQRLYDAIYQERYSGLLEEYADAYIEASPITHAKNLEGELLLVHGTGDDNVHYQSSERLINELVRLNKPFRFMAYPNRTHAVVDSEGEGTELHLNTMRARFFDEHLRSE